jgi:serine/threonine protein kinase
MGGESLHSGVSQLSSRETDDGLGSTTDPESACETRTGFEDDPLLGATVGNVVIEAVIAEGGMGRVYRGKQSHPTRTVAVKFLRHSRREALTERFRMEIELLGRLTHPNIAQVYTAGECRLGLDLVPFFVMEFIPNAKTLLRYSDAHRLTVRQRLALFLDACDAVAAGHRQGIIHRDLKPGNILVADVRTPTTPSFETAAIAGSDRDAVKPQVKVIDFGIAKVAWSSESGSKQFTETGELLGTRFSMSPEQFGGQSAEVDTPSDVYSLGVLLQQLLTGRFPHDLTGCSLVESARIVQKQPPAPLLLASSEVGRGLARDLKAVVGRCLQRHSSDRYADAGALAAELRRALAGERLSAGTLAAFHRQKGRRLLALLVAVALLTGAGVALLAGNGHAFQASTAERSAAESQTGTLQLPPSSGGFITQFSGGRTTPVGSVQLEFEKPLSSPLTLDNFAMTRNGKPVELAGASVQSMSSDGLQWSLTNLDLVNAQQGMYELRLIESGASPFAADGSRFEGQKSLKWERLEFKTFRFNLQDDSWNEHVVSMEGVERYREKTAAIPCIFIRPTELGEEGTIVMKFAVDFPVHAASLIAPVDVWTTGDPFPYDPGAWAFVDVSPDGENWTNVTTRGPNRNDHQRSSLDILPVVEGSQEVWVRSRLIGTKEWPGDAIIFSQFLRTEVGDPSIRFQLKLTGPQPSLIPPSNNAAAAPAATASSP